MLEGNQLTPQGSSARFRWILWSELLEGYDVLEDVGDEFARDELIVFGEDVTDFVVVLLRAIEQGGECIVEASFH